MNVKKPNRAEIRKYALNVPMSKSEKQRLQDVAYKAGMTMATFARIALLEYMKEVE